MTKFREKPALNHTVSMGVYCMQPSVFEYIPRASPTASTTSSSRSSTGRRPSAPSATTGFGSTSGGSTTFPEGPGTALEDQPPAFETIAAE